jgi:hypothetical protein
MYATRPLQSNKVNNGQSNKMDKFALGEGIFVALSGPDPIMWRSRGGAECLNVHMRCLANSPNLRIRDPLIGTNA